jgi:hypothetical protein
MMNPLGIFQLALVALQGVAYALNPKLRKREKKSAIAFGIFYVAFLLAGIATLILYARSLYFQK